MTTLELPGPLPADLRAALARYVQATQGARIEMEKRAGVTRFRVVEKGAKR